MTNGEKIQTILNVDRDCTEVHGENGTMTFTVTQEFWNAEYKEPTTKKPQPKIGKWISNITGRYLSFCSECGEMGVSYHNFCPNCGADMREVEDGNDDW